MTAAAGPQAAAIEWIWWLAIWGSSAIFLITMAALGWATFRRHDQPRDPTDRRTLITIAAATGLTAVVLLAFLVTDLFTGRALAESRRDGALEIRITAQQWWWDVEYVDSTPARRVRTANEIHIPVGRPVRILTHSADVIHSFWVPSLQGKRDLVPAHETELLLEASEPGVYRGQCAEFCGHQHAKMRILVIAESPEQFAAWYEAQLPPSTQPADSAAARGREVFLSGPCALCHTVRGTPAGGRAGPDLTHLASRQTLAAGTLPNGRGTLSTWILDPHALKPGVRMPGSALSGEDLDALLTYLEGLR